MKRYVKATEGMYCIRRTEIISAPKWLDKPNWGTSDLITYLTDNGSWDTDINHARKLSLPQASSLVSKYEHEQNIGYNITHSQSQPLKYEVVSL